MSSNKYAPGLHHVLLFDKFGGKIDVMTASHSIQAQQIGEDIMSEECDVNSFVVMLVNFNSLMARGKWG